MFGAARMGFLKVTAGGGGGGSGFPQVAALDEDVHAVSTTSHTGAFNLGTISPGDLLICVYGGSATDGTPNSALSGWTRRNELVFASSTGHVCTFLKIADGSETSPVTVTTDLAEYGTFLFMRITAGTWSGDLADVKTGGANNQTNAAPDPLTNTPGWTDDTLWIAVAAADQGTPDFTAYPYPSNNRTATPNHAEGVALAWCTKELNAASEDPGAFTIDASVRNTAYSIAVKPA